MNMKEKSPQNKQKWSIRRTNWKRFKRESKITTNVQDQDTIEEAYSCINKTILQASQKKHPQS